MSITVVPQDSNIIILGFLSLPDQPNVPTKPKKVMYSCNPVRSTAVRRLDLCCDLQFQCLPLRVAVWTPWITLCLANQVYKEHWMICVLTILSLCFYSLFLSLSLSTHTYTPTNTLAYTLILVSLSFFLQKLVAQMKQDPQVRAASARRRWLLIQLC